MEIFAMKYMFLTVIFMICTITSSNSSKEDKHHNQKLSAQAIKEKIGYMKPIRLGPTSHLNLTNLMYLLKESHLSQQHKLTGYDTAVKDANTGREKQENLLKLLIPEEAPKERIDVFEEQKTESIEEEKRDHGGFFDDSSEEYEQPFMRAAEGLDDGELQYDIDEDDLRVPI